MDQLQPSFKASRSSLQIFWAILFALFMREMQTRFGARRMGFIWVVMEPLAILVVILVFHSFLRAIPVQGIDFVMFMVSGIVPLHMMRSIVYRLTDAVSANQGLFAYRQLMPFDTFVARVIVEICTYFCAYVVICFFLAFWLGHDVRIHDPLAWILAIFEGVLISFALGIAFAMISHNFPSMTRVCKLSFIPIYLTAGVFFPVWRVPQDKLVYIVWNPYVEVIDSIRAAMFENYPVTEAVSRTYPVYFAIVLLFAVLFVYRGQRQLMRAPRQR